MGAPFLARSLQAQGRLLREKWGSWRLPPDTLYVGTFRIKYPPTRMKIKSGDHAANAGGS
jgi:hypothetical protein